jgi:thiol-disulfide isomerase/thioredoxin
MREGRALRAVAALLALAALTACTPEVEGAGDKGYVTGSGLITMLPPGEREEPAEVSGKTLEGEPIALADYAGDVVVLNVWGSWCGPCRTEAPILADTARDLADEGVQFLGINNRDSGTARPLAFQRTFDIPYPSIYDPDGSTLLSFVGTLPLNAVPTTVIIDRQGRVAGRVNGEVRSEATFRDLIMEVARS